MSLPEIMLWQHLRGAKAGMKFRRQHVIGEYVVDFYCRRLRFVVEVDGVAHDMGDRPERDQHRDQWLRARGYEILRIAAKDVLDDALAVADAISQRLQKAPPRHGEVALSAGGGLRTFHRNR